MKKIAFITTSAVAVLAGSLALAGPVEDIVAQLEAEGYSNIEVEVEDGETEIEGVLDGVKREVTLDTDTGEILEDKTEVDDDDDNEDDNEDDSDDDDADDK